MSRFQGPQSPRYGKHRQTHTQAHTAGTGQTKIVAPVQYWNSFFCVCELRIHSPRNFELPLRRRCSADNYFLLRTAKLARREIFSCAEPFCIYRCGFRRNARKRKSTRPRRDGAFERRHISEADKRVFQAVVRGGAGSAGCEATWVKKAKGTKIGAAGCGAAHLLASDLGQKRNAKGTHEINNYCANAEPRAGNK